MLISDEGRWSGTGSSVAHGFCHGTGEQLPALARVPCPPPMPLTSSHPHVDTYFFSHSCAGPAEGEVAVGDGFPVPARKEEGRILLEFPCNPTRIPTL